MVFAKGSMVLGREELLFVLKMGLQGGGVGPEGFWRSGRGVIEVRSGRGGRLPGEDPARTRGEAGSRTGGGSVEAPQRLGSGARPGSLAGRLSGTGGNHRKRLERRRGEFVRFLPPDPVPCDPVPCGEGAIGEKLFTILVKRGFILCVLQAFHSS